MVRSMRVGALVLAVVVGLVPVVAGCARSPKVSRAMYINVSIVDTANATVRAGMAIVVEDERIRDVLPMSDSRVAELPAAEVFDAQGAYALPGLVDAHVHLATDPNQRYAQALLRRDLYGGITAVRDMAGDTRALAELARSARTADIPAPDLYYAAVMAGPGFFDDRRTHTSTRGEVAGQVAWMRAISETTDIGRAVADARGTGATGIKLYAELSGELAQRISAEAHRQGMRVWSHAALFPTRPSEVVAAGVDSVSHAGLLAYEPAPNLPVAFRDNVIPGQRLDVQDAVFTRLFDRMREQGTVFEPTLALYELMERWLPTHADQGRPPHSVPFELAARFTAAAQRAGVDIAAGTDFPADRTDPYPALYQELTALVRAGSTPAQALHSATVINAGLLGARGELGEIRSGAYANFALFTENPVRDIENLRSISRTVKRGTAYPRTDFLPITADEWPPE